MRTDAPQLSVIDPRGGRGIGDALEGATGRWVPVAPLLINQRINPGMNPIFLRKNFQKIEAAFRKARAQTFNGAKGNSENTLAGVNDDGPRTSKTKTLSR
jgi:hypothetical protein